MVKIGKYPRLEPFAGFGADAHLGALVERPFPVIKLKELFNTEWLEKIAVHPTTIGFTDHRKTGSFHSMAAKTMQSRRLIIVSSDRSADRNREYFWKAKRTIDEYTLQRDSFIMPRLLLTEEHG